MVQLNGASAEGNCSRVLLAAINSARTPRTWRHSSAGSCQASRTGGAVPVSRLSEIPRALYFRWIPGAGATTLTTLAPAPHPSSHTGTRLQSAPYHCGLFYGISSILKVALDFGATARHGRRDASARRESQPSAEARGIDHKQSEYACQVNATGVAVSAGRLLNIRYSVSGCMSGDDDRVQWPFAPKRLLKMIFKLFVLSASLFGSLTLAAFPGGPYTIWSSSTPFIHMDNRGGLANAINGEGYVNGSTFQYWSPVPTGATNVYYINSASVTGSVYATGASGGGLTTQAFASAWLFTLLPGEINNYTITVPLSNNPQMAITVASGSTFPLAITLEPLTAGNLRQHWSLTDHGTPSSVKSPT